MPKLAQGTTLDRSQPIRRPTLHDETVTRLRQMILEGILPPGSRVPEGQLCEALGISRTPLREALKVLVSEGLVQLRPNRGSIIAPIDPEVVAQMFEVLETLDELVGTLVCARASTHDLKTLDSLCRRLEERHDSNDRSGYFAANQRIHRTLVQAAGNPVLETIYEGLSGKIMRARYMANLDVIRWSESLVEHQSLNDALQNRDGGGVATRLREHTHLTGIAVLRALRTVEDGVS